MTLGSTVHRAPAKINLHLRVGPARADGFHPLLTWMVTVGLFDTIRIEPADADAFTCSDPSLPTDDRNLAVRAIWLMRQARPVPAVAVHLDKVIPHGGGLGGGSSDAATVLMALDRLFPLPSGPYPAALAPLAEQLGSDVPFFLFGPSSICRGRGELIEPISPPRRARWAVLILPAIAVPTAEAYRTFDRLDRADAEAVTADIDFRNWAELPAEPLLDRLVNDLERSAFQLRPELAALRETLQNRLNRPVRMSGSGSSLFTLYDDASAASDAAASIDGSAAGLRAVAVELAAGFPN